MPWSGGSERFKSRGRRTLRQPSSSRRTPRAWLKCSTLCLGVLKVLIWIGKAATPIRYIAMAVGAVVGLWTALEGGGHIKCAPSRG